MFDLHCVKLAAAFATSALWAGTALALCPTAALPQHFGIGQYCDVDPAFSYLPGMGPAANASLSALKIQTGDYLGVMLAGGEYCYYNASNQCSLPGSQINGVFARGLQTLVHSLAGGQDRDEYPVAPSSEIRNSMPLHHMTLPSTGI